MVDILVRPDENSVLILRFIINKFAKIDVAADILESVAVLAVILKIAFVKSELRGLID
jgi:hypothetical protein